MSYKSCISFLLLVFAVLFFGTREAHACSCMPSPTALKAYEDADFVVITRAISVEKTEKAAPAGRISDGENYVDGVKSTRMMIERVFKGNLKAGDEITFAQGGGADCIWTFDEKAIGEQFLFYLYAQKTSAIRYASTCTRSNGLKYAADDLLYLSKLDKVRGKSRLSGTIRFEGDDELSVEGKRIRLTGAGKTYDLKTDKNGVYEIYDLPAGQYLVEFEKPPGWKLNAAYQSISSGLPVKGETVAPKGIPVTIEDKNHAELDINFEIDNAVRGKVYDPAGRPMNDVCLSLVHAQGETPKYFYKADCTNAAGSFEITEIPQGSYLLVINKDGKISSNEPFRQFYHPDVFERERATVITIGAGQTLEGLDVRVPRAEETVTVEGVFLYSDGKPVVGESVAFMAGKTKENVESNARAQTDAKGRFSIKILKGLEGELYGEMYTYSGEFEKCPKLEALIKKSGGNGMEIKTDVIKLQTEADLKDVELRFPFPGCRKARQE